MNLQIVVLLLTVFKYYILYTFITPRCAAGCGYTVPAYRPVHGANPLISLFLLEMIVPSMDSM